MPLTKQNLNINFGKGIDTKTDEWQLQPGQFLSLQNAIFTKGGLLSKRNGFQKLNELPDSASNNLCTFKDNLLAIGTDLVGLSQDTNQWFNKGILQPVNLSTIPVIRTSTSQQSVDIAVAPNGLGCVVFTDSNSQCYYQLCDSQTGQIIVVQTLIEANVFSPRVFILGYHFIITFVKGSQLKYLAIPYNNPTVVGTSVVINSQVSGNTAGYDGIVSNNNLYLSFDASDVGHAVRTTYIDSMLQVHVTKVISLIKGTLITIAADNTISVPNFYLGIWDDTTGNFYFAIYDAHLNVATAATFVFNTATMREVTSNANNQSVTMFYQEEQTYSYSSVRSDIIKKISITSGGFYSPVTVVSRGVGLASKAAYLPLTDTVYLLVSYSGSLQPTYFLIDENGSDIAKLAYSNGVGYMTNQILPNLQVTGSSLQCGYLVKTQLVPVSKNQGVSSNATFAQTGINLATFMLSQSGMIPNEIGNNLHLTGGFLWMYDGVKPVEHGFHLWPEDIGVVTTGTGGSITAQLYYYYVTYEWTDAQGNLHRSAPSIPYPMTTTGSTSSNTIYIPTLRQTYKITPNPVRIVIYRWSTAQPIPYQVTTISSPLINNTGLDSVSFVDTFADSSILGGVILYTFGGIVENIGSPACNTATLFKNRLVLVDSEDKNLLWYSKQVIEGVPVEMSDLFTTYVAPTISAQGSTGAIQCLSAMDDKLIIFKNDAIYYQVGNGPDNTGNNNDFSEPVFITSTVGCSNQQSIVFMPQGLMFQSDKGIWLLGRDLSTNYIGAPVEAYNTATVLSAVNVPATNQVRFTLNNGITLMYDYYYNQWGTFVNIPAVSSTIYQRLHTYVNSFGQVFQEDSGSYLDGSNPVLMSFTTSWFNLAGLQGYERFYFFYLLGKYLSPHKLSVKIAYDYNPVATQTVLITPNNINPAYGEDSTWGNTSPYGGISNVEQWKIYATIQRCQSFQITLSEIFDPSFSLAAGAGLTLSGLNLVVGTKKGYRPMRFQNQAGAS